MTEGRKVRKYRGSKTHGKGTHKNRRGGGSRGGRGFCGGCKHHFGLYGINWGKHGFVSRQRTERNAVNLDELEQLAERLVAEGKAQLVEGAIHLDLGAAGVGKVLGGGALRRKLVLKGGALSAHALEKLQKAGGKFEPA